MRGLIVAGIGKAGVVARHRFHGSPSRCGSHAKGARGEDEASVVQFPNSVLADVLALVSEDGLGKETGGGLVKHGEGFGTRGVLGDGHTV